jgi:two-component system OmpR family response regulator
LKQCRYQYGSAIGNNWSGIPFEQDPLDCDRNLAMENRIKVLVVDDDRQIRELLCDRLAEFGMQPDQAADGAEMKRALLGGKYDVIILDLMLPDSDGLTLCREVRQHSDIPLIILTARGEPTERIVGLELGADDYIVKPFDARELVARIQTILRRVRGQTGERRKLATEIRFGNWSLSISGRHLVAPDSTIVPLSTAEFRLLSALIEAAGRVLTRDQLLDAMRGRAGDALDRSVDIQVSRLRQKLREDVKEPRLIRTVRGEGYLLDAQILT